MIRIAEIELSKKKSILYALTGIYGIGISKSKFIVKSLKINPLIKLENLKDFQITLIREFIENSITVENNLKRKTLTSIKHLIDIQCYRGKRHQNNLPTRGQRTRTNAKTQKKKRKYLVVNKNNIFKKK
jgi:small subunit ribosomal protein S13